MLLLSYVLAINYPTAKFHFSDLENETYDTLVWEDTSISKPTKEQVQTLYNNELPAYALREVQAKRYYEYPSLTDFADAMYWASKGDNTKLDNYYAACEAIKDKYPKGE
jgi:hypothetical protein